MAVFPGADGPHPFPPRPADTWEVLLLARFALFATIPLAAIALVAALAATPAAAQSSGAAGPRGMGVVQLANGSTFNWLAKKKTAGVVTRTVLVSADTKGTKLRMTVFGRGSYICSPAGFGKKSRCFAR